MTIDPFTDLQEIMGEWHPGSINGQPVCGIYLETQSDDLAVEGVTKVYTVPIDVSVAQGDAIPTIRLTETRTVGPFTVAEIERTYTHQRLQLVDA